MFHRSFRIPHSALALFTYFGGLLLGCGSNETVTRTTTPGVNLNGSSIQLSCKDYLTNNAAKRDSDNDGLTDLQEIYGYKVTLAGVETTIYSDPRKADTDGDGTNDGEEIKALAGTDLILRHPGIRDYDLTVFAKGASNGVETADAVGRGWNYYPQLIARKGDKLRVHQYDSGKWSVNTAPNGQTPVNARGDASWVLPESAVTTDECITNKRCIAGEKLTALIGQFSSALVSSPASDAPFKIGTLMDATTLTFDLPVVPFSDADSKYLFLRANDYGSLNYITDNGGSIRVLITLSNAATDFPQPPTGALQTETIKAICPAGFQAP